MKAGRVVRYGMLVVTGAILLSIVAVFFILTTGPGHRFLRGRILAAVENLVNGSVHIGSLDGKLWKDVEFSNVELITSDGRPAIRAEKIAVTFALSDILRGRYIFRSVTLIRPTIELDQDSARRWNIERLFRIGEDTTKRVPGRRPLVLLRDVTITQGTFVIRARGARDTIVTRVIEGVSTDMARFRLSHPDSTALEADVRSLVARIDNPRLDLRNAAGTLALDGDSLRFDLDHVTMPGTQATLAGRMRWGGERMVLHAAVNATALTFADVRSVVPELPEDGGGQIALFADMLEDGTLRADVRQADLRSGRSAVSGKGVFTIRPGGTGTLRNVDFQLQPLDLALLRPYLDTLPVEGLVRGRVQGDGSLKNLVFDASLAWTDEATAGRPVNDVSAQGRIVLGGENELDFRGVTLRRADVAFGSIRQFAPSIDLAGRLRARGTLEGPWRSAQFRGALDHYADSGHASSVHGEVRLGIGGGPTRVDAEIDVDSLSFDLLRRTYPEIPVTGKMRGRVVAHGALDTLAVAAALSGSAGTINAQGIVGVHDTAVTIAVGGVFDSLNLAGMRDGLPPSELAGAWRIDMSLPLDNTRVSTGTLTLDLTGLTVANVGFGPGRAVVQLDPGVIRVDTMTLAFMGGGLEATGFVGRGEGGTGTLNFTVHADTLGYLEPLVRFYALSPGDSGAVRLDGKGIVNGTIQGTTSAWTLMTDVTVDAVNVSGNVAHDIKANVRLDQGPDGLILAARATADTASIGAMGYRPVSVEAAGPLDSLTIGAEVRFFERSALRTRFTTWTDSTQRSLLVDSLQLELPVHTWRLSAPVSARIGDGSVTMDSLDFRSTGAGYLIAVGTISGEGASDFTLAADSIPLEDIYAAAQRDTTGIKGAVTADLKLAGPASSPLINLRAMLADGRLGEYNVPLLQVEGAYRARNLELTGNLSRDSVRLVTLTGTVPIDLSLGAIGDRRLDGPINIVVQADTLDMQVLNALTATITGLSGRMALDMRVRGTWKAPMFSGFVDISGGTLQVPSIGANYEDIELRLASTGDSTWRVERGQLRAGGTLDITGLIRFPDLTHPTLDMELRSSRFNAFDIRGFGSLTSTGRLRLTGPLIGAHLTGNVVADEGAFEFANLVEKRIVSLDDPEFRAMVDSNLAGADLAPAGHQIFFDSLRIDNLTLEMGPDVWLRSSEANIQLGGDIQVTRRFEDNLARYRIDGTLRALRGNYKLAIGIEGTPLAVTRDFRVTRGTVRFFGTPDMNPEMAVVAEYTTRSVQGSSLTVRAIIEGTLLYPRLRLESDSRVPLTETEIASYLMFGRPSPDIGVGGAGSQVATVIGGALGGVGQALVSELGLPINYLTITPNASTPSTAAGASTGLNARIEAGAQLNDRTFLILSAGLCEINAGRTPGLSLEYRLSGIWSVAGAVEPLTQGCGGSQNLAQLKAPYQFSFDLFWQSGIR